MTVIATKLTLIRGDAKTYTLHFTDAAGADIDISTWKVYFTIKTNVTDTDDNAVLKVDTTSHIDPTHGKTAIVITAANTDSLSGKYFYDIQIKKPTLDIKTVLIGEIEFTRDITRRTT